MSDVALLRFPYRLPPRSAALMVVAALAVPAVTMYAASAIQKPIRLFGLITLSTQQGATFLWGLSALGTLAALVAIYAAVRSQIAPRFVELGAQGALLPKAALSSPLILVPYDCVRNVHVANVPGQQMVIVDSLIGESRLMSKSFASPEHYSAFLAALCERVQQAPRTGTHRSNQREH